MNEVAKLELAVTLTFNLDLTDPDDCHRILRLLRETAKRSFVLPEQSHFMSKQLEFASLIVDLVARQQQESPPDELG
jgi:hypothetical protein